MVQPLVFSLFGVFFLIDFVLKHLLSFGSGLVDSFEGFLFFGLQKSNPLMQLLHLCFLLLSQLSGVRYRLKHGGIIRPRGHRLHVTALQEGSLLALVVSIGASLIFSEGVGQLMLAVSGVIVISR